jgi:hypothetical protein
MDPPEEDDDQLDEDEEADAAQYDALFGDADPVVMEQLFHVMNLDESINWEAGPAPTGQVCLCTCPSGRELLDQHHLLVQVRVQQAAPWVVECMIPSYLYPMYALELYHIAGNVDPTTTHRALTQASPTGHIYLDLHTPSEVMMPRLAHLIHAWALVRS